MTSDNGGAPCVHDGLLSLAICKPKIRSSAAVGSLIIGIGGKILGGRLIYAARVTDKLSDGRYYRDRCFYPRPDCIYREVNGLPNLVKRARYHADGSQIGKDVGIRFEKANVLLSSDFRYFGKKGTREYESHGNLSSLVDRLMRGHRVNHGREVIEELEKLEKDLWEKFSPTDQGEPSESDTKKRCNREGKIRQLYLLRS
jgi:putative DNA base modification enzyme with NMAD domain